MKKDKRIVYWDADVFITVFEDVENMHIYALTHKKNATKRRLESSTSCKQLYWLRIKYMIFYSICQVKYWVVDYFAIFMAFSASFWVETLEGLAEYQFAGGINYFGLII